MQTATQTTAAVTGTVAATDSLGATSMMDMLLIAMFIGCGVYLIYSYILQRRSKVILANKMICPSSCDIKKCKNPEEFLRFILPRVLILGIGLLIFGGIYIADHMIGDNNLLSAMVLMVLPLILLGWYVYEQRKAVKRYW